MTWERGWVTFGKVKSLNDNDRRIEEEGKPKDTHSSTDV